MPALPGLMQELHRLPRVLLHAFAAASGAHRRHGAPVGSRLSSHFLCSSLHRVMFYEATINLVTRFANSPGSSMW